MTINADRAAYRVLDPSGFFGDDDHLYREGEEILFDGEPNEQMEPLNDLAHQRLTVLLNRLDDQAKEAALKANRPFAGRPRTLDGAIAIATEEARKSMSIMGTKDKNVSTTKVERGDVPETGIEKRGRGRPVGSTKKSKPASVTI